MIVNVNTLEAAEMGGGLSVTFPFSSATGMAASAAVYIVLEPDGVLPEHTDSAEEWLLVLEGEVEATVGGQTVTLTEGDLAVGARDRSAQCGEQERRPGAHPRLLRSIDERRAVHRAARRRRHADPCRRCRPGDRPPRPAARRGVARPLAPAAPRRAAGASVFA